MARHRRGVVVLVLIAMAVVVNAGIEIKPTSKDPMRALVRTTNTVRNQKGEALVQGTARLRAGA